MCGGDGMMSGGSIVKRRGEDRHEAVAEEFVDEVTVADRDLGKIFGDLIDRRGRLLRLGEMSEDYAQPLHRGTGGSMYTRKAHATREAPMRDQG